MPYAHQDDLPESIKKHLPEHAQHIYMSAFNHAWEEYANVKKRRTPESREQIAHKVAWSAVKKKYRKGANGQWVAQSTKK